LLRGKRELRYPHMQVGVLGAGAWGTALAKVLSEGGNTTTLWTWQESHAQEMREQGENRQFLAGVSLPGELSVTSDLRTATELAEIVFVVVPSQAVGPTLELARPFLRPDVKLVCASKGIESGTLHLMSQVLASTICPHDPQSVSSRVAVVSGPSFAKEVAGRVPTNLVAASTNEALSVELQELVSTDWLRVYTSTDPIGVEVGGALKNVIAIAAGACDGLGLGRNTRAALMTRGVAEMARLTVALGGRALTISGLAGLGDLVLTCTGELSRNRTLGLKLGGGGTLEDALLTSDGVSEGYTTAKSVHELSLKAKVDLPICEAVYSVLYLGEAAPTALKTLLSRPLGPE
jgi:glycerol-3-phosphate dehydrogenase (NAD(P)+)